MRGAEAYFIFRQDIHLDRRSKVRMPFRKVIGLEGLRRLTRIHNQDTFRVLNHPSVNWKKLCPGIVEQYVHLPHDA